MINIIAILFKFMDTPKQVSVLSELLTTLPGIGPRQALRLAFYIADLPKNQIEDLINSLTLIQKTKRCQACFLIHEGTDVYCDICRDPRRDAQIIAIIEKDTDQISLEQARGFSGHYLILGKLPKDGILAETAKIRLRSLMQRFPQTAPAKEFILALSPTTTGDINSSVLNHLLKDHAARITRLGRGIPTGGEIEFADEETLENAFRNRG